VDYSGGIREEEDILRVLDAGAAWACIGSIACTDPRRTATWLERYPDRLIVSADTLDGRLRARGWQEATSLSLFDLVDTHQPRRLACTEISRDGTLAGPDLDLYRRLRARYPALHLIASGGVRDLDDVRALLAEGLDGVIIGKALLEGRITPGELVTLPPC
jgi:phosphoribosylformimino-5-aminoimidazole carboxamide ribotide isomerase